MTSIIKGMEDLHTHSRFSVDSEADVEKMIEKAISLGLKAYAVTDHCEVNRWYTEEYYGGTKIYPYFDFKSDYERSVGYISGIKERYQGRIELVCGIELGQAHQFPDIAQTVVDDKRIDFILGSVHQLPQTEDFAFLKYEEMTQAEAEELLERYFIEICRLCEWGKLDSLAHLTYPLRYYIKNGIKVDISKFDCIIESALKTLAQNGKALEINGSGIRQGAGMTFPTAKYAKMFNDVGGELITLGSDAHTADDIGSGICEAAKEAKSAGFERAVYFKQRKPIFIDI